MNILIDIGHPAHVHVFKHYHDEMVAKGHAVLFTAKDKECTIQLLEAYKLPYVLIGKPFSGAIKKLFGLWFFGRRVLRQAKMFEADLFVSISSMYAAHVAFFLGKPHLVMDDTEHSKFEHMLYKPFSKYVLTPSCFEKYMGPKHIKYDGYHELAYLHPSRFKPDKQVLSEIGIKEDEKYSLLRFVSWNAGHDIHAGGLTNQEKQNLVKELSVLGRVFISSEKELPSELEPYRLKIRPEQMHTVMDNASLYVGEGASMASECAMLGTPAVYINTLNAGTLKEQEAYGLIYNFRVYEGVLDIAKAILLDPTYAEKHSLARDKMLSEKVDVTTLLCRLSTEIQTKQASIFRLYTKMTFKPTG